MVFLKVKVQNGIFLWGGGGGGGVEEGKRGGQAFT